MVGEPPADCLDRGLHGWVEAILLPEDGEEGTDIAGGPPRPRAAGEDAQRRVSNDPQDATPLGRPLPLPAVVPPRPRGGGCGPSALGGDLGNGPPIINMSIIISINIIIIIIHMCVISITIRIFQNNIIIQIIFIYMY